ncbi:universal stress protein [soil metagenome]
MKVIVALDQTDFAEHIVDAVASSSWPPDTQIKMLTVVEPLNWQSPCCVEWNKEATNALEKRKLVANEVAMQARQKIQKCFPQCMVHVEIRFGDPKEEIITSATEWMADRIIIGAHGNAPNRFFRGSVARSVAQHCGCSVQLIRLKKECNNDHETKSKPQKSKIAVVS